MDGVDHVSTKLAASGMPVTVVHGTDAMAYVEMTLNELYWTKEVAARYAENASALRRIKTIITLLETIEPSSVEVVIRGSGISRTPLIVCKGLFDIYISGTRDAEWTEGGQ